MANLFQRLHGPAPTPDWGDVESVAKWIEYTRSNAFFAGARHDEISRAEARELVALLAQVDRCPEGQDPAEGLGRNDESAVGNADAPKPFGNLSGDGR